MVEGFYCVSLLRNRLCCTDDNSPTGFVTFYVGEKTSAGTEVEKAGLVGGIVYGLKIIGWLEGSTAPPPNSRFSLEQLDDLSSHTSRSQTAAELSNKGATLFARPEVSKKQFALLVLTRKQDSEFSAEGVLFFATTGSSSGPSRVWRLTFDDISQPELGGLVVVLGSQATVPYYDNLYDFFFFLVFELIKILSFLFVWAVRSAQMGRSFIWKQMQVFRIELSDLMRRRRIKCSPNWWENLKQEMRQSFLASLLRPCWDRRCFWLIGRVETAKFLRFK